MKRTICTISRLSLEENIQKIARLVLEKISPGGTFLQAIYSQDVEAIGRTP